MASVMMAVATWMVASTSTGPSTLGSTCRHMMRIHATPSDARGLHVFLVALDHLPRTVAHTAPVGQRDGQDQHPERQASFALGNIARPMPADQQRHQDGGKDSITSQTASRSASMRPPTKPDDQAQAHATSTDSTTDGQAPTNERIRAP